MKDTRWRGLPVTTLWCFGKRDGVLLALIFRQWNDRLGNKLKMPVAVFHVCRKFRSGSTSTWTSSLALVVADNTPYEWNVISVCLATRIGRRALYMSSVVVASLTWSPSCDSRSFRFPSRFVRRLQLREQSCRAQFCATAGRFLSQICWRKMCLVLQAPLSVSPLQKPPGYERLLF